MVMSPRLSLRLLGAPRLYWDDQPLVVQRLQVRAILYYLACQRTIVGRNDLILLFWPDVDEETGRRNLRDLLSKLRNELPDSSILKSDREYLSLDQEKIFVDVLVFEEFYDQLNLPFLLPEDRALPDPIYQKLTYALKLWEAPRFLSGARVFKHQSYEDWVIQTAQRLQSKRVSLMTRLARHYMIVGDFNEALTVLDEILADDDSFDLYDVIYYRLETLYRLDRITQAYEYLQEINDLYQPEDFGRNAGPLQDLERQVKLAQKNGPSVITPISLGVQYADIPFVGQEELLDRIRKSYQRGGILILTGEPGIGKSRIIQEFLAQLKTFPRVFKMKAVDMQQTVSFHPVLEMLRQEISSIEWQKLERFWIAQLIPYLPEISHTHKMTGSSFDGLMGHQLRAVFEAFYQIIKLASNTQRTVLVVEDAQWADEDTLALLAYLIQRDLFKESGLLIITYRPDQIPGALKKLSTHTQWQQQREVIEVPYLTYEDIAAMARNFFRHPVSGRAIQQLREETGGNPLFMIETLRAIQELSIKENEEQGWQRIPLSAILHSLIRDRFGHLDSHTFQVLVSAAVVGKSFKFDWVQSASGFTTEKVLNALEILETNGLIAVIPEVFDRNRYIFRQGLTREVAALEAGTTRQQIIHTRLAAHLEEIMRTEHRSDLAPIIAQHLTEAGKSHQAFEYWLKAANDHLKNNDWRGACVAFDEAQQLAGVLQTELDDQQIYNLYIHYGNQALSRYDLERANSTLKRAVGHGQRRNSSLLMGSGLSAQAHLFFLRDLYMQAHALADNALTYLSQGPFHEYVRARNRKAIIYVYQSQLEAAINELDQVIALADRAVSEDDHLAIAETCYYYSLAQSLFGEPQRAVYLANRGMEIAQRAQSVALQLRLGLAIGYAERLQGKYKESMIHFQFSLRLSDAYYAWRYVLENLIESCQSEMMMGRVFHAESHLNNAFHLSEMHESRSKLGELFCLQGRVALCSGDFKEANQLFYRGLEMSSLEADVIDNQHYLGWSQYLTGEVEAGMMNLRSAIQSAQLHKYLPRELESRAHLALLHFLDKRYKTALEELTLVTEESRHHGFAGAGSALAYVQAREGMRTGDADAVEYAISSLMQISEREDNMWLRWHAIELQIKQSESQGKDTTAYQKQKKDLLIMLTQGLPQERHKVYEKNSPCLIFLK